MRLDTAIDRFMTTRETAGYARSTLRNNRSQLNLLANELASGIEVHQISADKCEAAWRKMTVGRSPSSMQQIHATINMFFKWCISRSLVKVTWINPMMDIRPPKTQRRERFRVPVTDMTPMLDHAGNPRDRALMAAAWTLMLRQSELTSLKVEDVNLTNGEITVVIHKTNDSDTMPIPMELDRELRTWLTHYTNAVGPLHGHYLLFPARRVASLTRDELGRIQLEGRDMVYVPTAPITRMEEIAQRVMRAVGYELESGEGMHTLRRSAARALFDRLVDEGYDGAIRMVQSILHHANTSTTERYIGLTLDKQRRDVMLRGQVMYPAAQNNGVRELRAVQ